MKDRGFIMASLLITTTFTVLIGISVTQLVLNNFRQAAQELYRVNAQFAADSGADFGIAQLNLDSNWAGTGGEVDLVNNPDMRVTYEVTVADTGSRAKALTATGRTYAPPSAATPRVERQFELALTGIGPLDLGTFSIVTGVGGLILENSAKIVAGDVFVNGEIIMSGTAQIGTSTNPVNVRAAHQICPSPADATYPQVCSLGENGEPISISNSAVIYGEVQATNQLDGSGMQDPGLVAGSPAPEALPPHDRAAQVAAVSNTISSGGADCDSNSGTLTIPANTKIEGDVEWQKKCEITIQGDVWITGNLTMRNTAQVIVAEGLSELTTIMVDGSSGAAFRNSTKFTSNSLGIGARLITYHSTAACSIDEVSPCEVTGVDLANSRDDVTITMDQSFSAPESILYARWTQILIENSGDIGALLGQTVRLENTTTVTFGTSVTGGGGGSIPLTWLIDSYKRTFD